MVGGALLSFALDSDKIDSVVSISRKSTGLKHNKLQEVIHPDFSDLNSIDAAVFSDIDCVYYCIGAYTGTVSDERFKEITVDYTNNVIDKIVSHSPNSMFCLLSGSGADRTEKSRISFAKYKGISENYLFDKIGNRAYSFRPGYIYPVEKRKEPNAMYSISRALYPVLKLFGRNTSIKSTELALGMFLCGVQSGWKKNVLENRDILDLVDEQS